MSTVMVDKREKAKEEIQELLRAMLETVEEMSHTNVSSYPLKYNVLRNWWQALFDVHDALMRRLIDKDYIPER